MALIVFEGLDGSGKTTLMQRLSTLLSKKNVAHILTREPGGTPLGDEIRNMLLRKDGDTPSPRCELLLYEAVRAHHVDQKIKPALKDKKWVLCDRFTASSIAFQAGGRKIKQQDVQWLNTFATDKLKVDLFVLLDLSVEECEKRIMNRGEKDRMESEKSDFYKKIRQSYLKQARSQPKNWLVLDATKEPEMLFNELVLRLKKWLG